MVSGIVVVIYFLLVSHFDHVLNGDFLPIGLRGCCSSSSNTVWSSHTSGSGSSRFVGFCGCILNKIRAVGNALRRLGRIQFLKRGSVKAKIGMGTVVVVLCTSSSSAMSVVACILAVGGGPVAVIAATRRNCRGAARVRVEGGRAAAGDGTIHPDDGHRWQWQHQRHGKATFQQLELSLQ